MTKLVLFGCGVTEVRLGLLAMGMGSSSSDSSDWYPLELLEAEEEHASLPWTWRNNVKCK